MTDRQETGGENNLIIFDFDRTLFDTDRFVQDLRKAFIRRGVDEKVFNDTFKKAYGSCGYSPQEHMRLVQISQKGLDPKVLETSYDEVLFSGDNHTFEGADLVLENLKKEFRLILMTFGEMDYQIDKIRSSGLGGYFEAITITLDKTKTKHMCNLINNAEYVFFIDDKVDALTNIKKAFPKICTIRFNRPGDKYGAEKNTPEIDLEIKSLSEMAKVIDNTLKGDIKLCKQ